MICKTCGGDVPKGTEACPFCGTDCRDQQEIVRDKMRELMSEGGEGENEGCGGCESESCGEAGLTDPSKGLKYGLFLVGLIVVIIGGAFVIKMAGHMI